jgi:WD40 repeat protein
LVKRWIQEQAPFDGPDQQAPLAGLIPRQRHPAPPASYHTAVPIAALAFRPDGKELAVGGYHEVTIWDAASGALLRRIDNVEQQTLGLQYSPDGTLLAVAGGTPGRSGEVSLFDPERGTLVATLGQMADVVFGARFSPAGDRLAACSADRAIRLFDLASRSVQTTIEDHADWVLGIAWSPDGAQIASASRDKTCRVFDAKTGESLTTYSGHGDTVFAVAFAADGKTVYSVGADRRLHAWGAAGGNPALTFGGAKAAIDGPLVALASSGERLFTGSADRNVREHKLADLAVMRIFAGPSDFVLSLSFHEPTRRLAAGSFDGAVRIWNADDGQEMLSFYAAPGYAPPAAR